MTDYFTHVNRGVIDANRKHGRDDPPVTFRRGKRGKATYCNEVALPPGSRMIYSAHEPLLPCGARLVVVSPTAPEVIR
jgi:hypothetical protein